MFSIRLRAVSFLWFTIDGKNTGAPVDNNGGKGGGETRDENLEEEKRSWTRGPLEGATRRIQGNQNIHFQVVRDNDDPVEPARQWESGAPLKERCPSGTGY